MPTTAVHLSKHSQLPLADGEGKSIVPRTMSKCPRCATRCRIVVIRSIPTVDAVLRDRICTGCGYEFTTAMGILDHCDTCGKFDTFECRRSERIATGIFRIYQCKCCGNRVKTMESFPVLPENLKKPRPYLYD